MDKRSPRIPKDLRDYQIFRGIKTTNEHAEQMIVCLNPQEFSSISGVGNRGPNSPLVFFQDSIDFELPINGNEVLFGVKTRPSRPLGERHKAHPAMQLKNLGLWTGNDPLFSHPAAGNPTPGNPWWFVTFNQNDSGLKTVILGPDPNHFNIQLEAEKNYLFTINSEIHFSQNQMCPPHQTWDTSNFALYSQLYADFSTSYVWYSVIGTQKDFCTSSFVMDGIGETDIYMDDVKVDQKREYVTIGLLVNLSVLKISSIYIKEIAYYEYE